MMSYVGKLRSARVSMDWDDGLPSVPCYLRIGARYWNGWDCPIFTLDDVRTYRDDFKAIVSGLTFDDDDIPHVFNECDEEVWDDVEVYWNDGIQYVTIGYCAFTWIERA